MNNNFSIINDTTYYFGQQSSVGNNVNTAIAVPIPQGTIVEVLTNTYVSGSFGTSEGSTLTIYSNTNSSTPTTDLVTNNVQFATGNPRNFSQSFSGLSISVASGGTFIEIETPTFITPPSGGVIRVTLIIEI